ncbi:MAG TPA: acyltransferase family protein [Dokdonella sp.]|uniref:acyltransferase family protein n=1 Tax=Dokdonella sp. TaxID=2291710 RepID=UPI002D7FFCD6|nr:acyltransferase family protein [Dokdonella sp.]HET9032599.1 acyltransferase family protein [Dokdonella sp.]
MQKQQHRYRLGYRSDIEGLRAVAILLVVAAHAKVTWLAGGFIGVDVFFVLSGYLITGLLVREIETTGDLRFAEFYARRFRRLLPGLLLMLTVTSVFAYLLVAPGEQSAQATAAASAAAWISNFYFAFSNLGYFAPAAETNLFLHTWSLGVEEQFYLVWPLIVIFGLGFGREELRGGSRERCFIVFAALCFSSFIASNWLMRSDPVSAFFMMPSRAWQFSLGAMAWLWLGKSHQENPAAPPQGKYLKLAHLGSSCSALGWIGLIAIVYSAFRLDATTPYPGTWALVPSIGTVIILIAGTNAQSKGVGALLSTRLMQSIGQVSYSWYLWHWPILLLGATVLDTELATVRFSLILLSLLLAVLSNILVEDPIRQCARLVARPRFAVAGSLALVIAASGIAIRWHNAAFDRMNAPEQMRYQQAKFDAPVIYGMGCDDWYNSADVKICAFGPQDAKHTAVAMGDSIGLQWFPALAKVFDKPDWRLLVLTKSSCPMVEEPFFYSRIGREYTECDEWRSKALTEIAALKPDIVVLGSTYYYGFTASQLKEGTERLLQPLVNSVRRIFILRSTPRLLFDGPSCAAPRSALFSSLSGDQHCASVAYNEHNELVFESLESAASRFPNVRIVDMTDAVCPNGTCRAERDGVIVFRDSQHMSATFAESLGDALSKQLSIAD